MGADRHGLGRRDLAVTAADRTSASEAWAAVMEQGNQRYEAGDYAGAIAKYRMIVDSGVENGQIDYNRGTLTSRMGNR